MQRKKINEEHERSQGHWQGARPRSQGNIARIAKSCTKNINGCQGVKLFSLKYVTITTVPAATVATVTITTVTNITTVTVTTVTITTVTFN